MIRSVEQEVFEILTKYPETRDDDNLLYQQYLINHHCTTANIFNFFGNFEYYQKQFAISELETVGRARRKVQEKHPELSASDKVKNARYEQQIDFMNYAKS